MRLLVDTHLLIWAATDDARLSDSAKSMLEDRANDLTFSVVSLWEVAIKFALGRADFPHHPAVLRNGLLSSSYRELEINARHVMALIGLANRHRDPFDRLLIAQATADGLTLLTADATVAAYGGAIRRV